MKFKVTPEQIDQGAEYYFSDFRKELRRDILEFIAKNKPEMNEEDQDDLADYLLNLNFDVYYWTAIENDIEDLLEFFREQDPTLTFDLPMLQAIQAEGLEAIKMLRAIMRKKVTDWKTQGYNEEDAALKLRDYIKECLQRESAVLQDPDETPLK